MTNIVAIESVAMEIIGGKNKLCSRNYFEARNDIVTRYCSRLVKIVASVTIGCNNKCCNIKYVEARSEIAAKHGLN